MDYVVDDKLLKAVKDELQVTFIERDESIKNMIKSGMVFITSRVGELDFSAETEVGLDAMDLLRNYCRYSWDGYRQIFPHDYLDDILHLQIINGISRRSQNAD